MTAATASEGRLRATSDGNLMLVLCRFDLARADGLREALRLAQTTARLAPRFVLESELGEASIAFANQFTDIEQRHRVLHGDDPLVGLRIDRVGLELVAGTFEAKRAAKAAHARPRGVVGWLRARLSLLR